MSTLVSQREYARRRGISHMAVQRAVSSGRITLVDGKVDPDLADRQWRDNTDPTKPRNRFTGSPKHTREDGEPSTPMPIDAAAGLADLPAGARSARGYAQARATREGYLARLAKAQYEKVMEQLISADEVRVTAFNRARRTRDLLLAVPDRVSALLAAENDAEEIHRILTEEITRSCEELSRVQSV